MPCDDEKRIRRSRQATTAGLIFLAFPCGQTMVKYLARTMETHPELYLLDTSALSEFALKAPHPAFATWILTVPEQSLAISASAVIEVQRGIEKLKASNPRRAAELDEWLTALLGNTDVSFLPMNARAARIFGKMTSVPALKNLWVPAPHASQPKLGQDLQIAATSIAYEVPVASPNVRDFISIHEHFPLPGLFAPLSGTWAIPHNAIQPPVPYQATDAERIGPPSAANVRKDS